MSYNYTGFVNEMVNLAGTTAANSNFIIELPNAIDYGEQRIFRDLDLIANVVVDTSQVCSPGNRQINAPGAFVVVNGINIITPAGTPPSGGKRNQLSPISKDLIDFLYPDASITGIPVYYCSQSQGFGANPGVVLLGPWPDQGYVTEITGTQRPATLSATNPNTFLTTNLPDLFLIACMIHMQAYQKNWSSIGQDPAAGASYETQYQKLLVGADAEELRKRYAGSTVLPPPGMSKQPASPDAKA